MATDPTPASEAPELEAASMIDACAQRIYMMRQSSSSAHPPWLKRDQPITYPLGHDLSLPQMIHDNLQRLLGILDASRVARLKAEEGERMWQAEAEARGEANIALKLDLAAAEERARVAEGEGYQRGLRAGKGEDDGQQVSLP